MGSVTDRNPSLFHDQEHGGVSPETPLLVEARGESRWVGLCTSRQVRRLIHKHTVHGDNVGVRWQLPHPCLLAENETTNMKKSMSSNTVCGLSSCRQKIDQKKTQKNCVYEDKEN